MNHRKAILWAGTLGATGVALGAFGAHALKGRLEAAGTAASWDTAARYQLLHAAALLALAAWLRGAPNRPLAWAARLWVLGTVLFSGSLYLYCLGGPRGVVFLTPIGGACLIAGWSLAAIGAAAAQ
jgi:uncharacterized membrane protein YgdD (TMEM256/DUF423 family)